MEDNIKTDQKTLCDVVGSVELFQDRAQCLSCELRNLLSGSKKCRGEGVGWFVTK
jgi:hypothetical protein